MRRPHGSRSAQRRIARERIDRLLHLAQAEISAKPERSLRYVRLARAIAMKCRLRMPRRWRRMICKRCECLLIPGKTSRVRLRGSRLNVTCASCGKVHRYPYRSRIT